MADDLVRSNDNGQSKLSERAALFVMQAKEQYKLAQTAVQGIIEGVTCLMQVKHSALKTNLTRKTVPIMGRASS